MSPKLSRIGLGVVGLWVALSVTAQEQPADFAHQVPLALSGEGPWYRLALPLEIQLQARQTDLSDLRVFNAAGQAQAYALVRETARSRENSTTDVKWFPLYNAADDNERAPSVRVQSSANGTLVQVQPSSRLEAGEEELRGWLLDASAIKAPLQQLILDWTSERDGFQRFTIEASDDLQHWQAWGEGQVARLTFADERVEQHEVSLPGQPARYLRLLWESPSSAPVLTSAQLQSGSRESLPLPLPLVWSQPLAGSTTKAGQYTWQLPMGLNVEQVQVELSQANSLAPVTLAGRRESSQPWQSLGSGLLYRLTQNGQDVLQNQLQLSGQTVQQLKLTVDERGGGLGAQAPALRFAVRPTQVVFLARGEGPYSLALGNATMKAASLPLATLVPDYKPSRLATLGTATLSGAATSTPVTAATPATIETNWKKIGLWAVLLISVLVLAAMALSLLRKPPVKN